MAVLNWLSDLKTANPVAAFDQAQQDAQALAIRRDARMAQLQDRQRLGTALGQAGGIMQGDPNALATAYGANPDVAAKVQTAYNAQLASIGNAAQRIVQESTDADGNLALNPRANAIYQYILPRARALLPQEQLPDSLDAETLDKIAGFSSAIQGAKVHSVVKGADGNYYSVDQFGNFTRADVGTPHSVSMRRGADGRMYRYDATTNTATPVGQNAMPSGGNLGDSTTPPQTGGEAFNVNVDQPLSPESATAALAQIEASNGQPFNAAQRQAMYEGLTGGRASYGVPSQQSPQPSTAQQMAPAPPSVPTQQQTVQTVQANTTPAPDLRAIARSGFNAGNQSKTAKSAQELLDMQAAGIQVTPDDQVYYLRNSEFPKASSDASDILASLSFDKNAPSGEEYLKTIPAGDVPTVKAFADGRIPLPTGTALKDPDVMRRITEAVQYDPTFNAGTYKSRLATWQDATKGALAKTTNAMNTAVGHLGTLYSAIPDLRNYSGIGSVPLNAIKNFIGEDINSDPRYAKFNTARTAVGDELMRVYRQVGASDHDVIEWRRLLSSNSSPEYLQETIKTMASLLKSKIESNEAQLRAGMGRMDATNPLVSPHAMQTLNMILTNGNPQAVGNVAGEVQEMEWTPNGARPVGPATQAAPAAPAAVSAAPAKAQTPPTAVTLPPGFPPPSKRVAGRRYIIPVGKYKGQALRWNGTSWDDPEN